MWIVCDKCRTGYEIRDELGGRLSRCRCGANIVLPVPDAERMMDWATTVAWPILFQFMTHGGARGHSQSTVRRLIRVCEQRRWAEEWRVRGRREAQQQIDDELARQKLIEDEKRRLAEALRNHQQLERILQLSPEGFEIFVADVFRAQGYEAIAVGQSNDGGVDVEIYDAEKRSIWAVAQCKRYVDIRIPSKQIREFVGACNMSAVDKGFFITTGRYTKQAIATAERFSWLTLYDGMQFAQLVATVYRDKIKSS
jgi:restriction system protein